MNSLHSEPQNISHGVRRLARRATANATAIEPLGDHATPQAELPNCRIMQAGTEFIAHLLRQLGEVRFAEDTEEERQATYDAYNVTRELLIDATTAAGLEGRTIPYGCVTTDPEGGVRIEWFRSDSRVHLVVRESRERCGYIYYQSPAGYGIEPVSAYALAKCLKLIPD